MSAPKVLSQEQLLEVLHQKRREGQRIVTTNGCFDVLHVGHLRYLQAARAEGDLLVVLLNSDASVRQIKGNKRPVTPENERAELLAGLSCVDYVTVFDESSPALLLKTIAPDIHVKGGDYDACSLPEAEPLKAVGTELRFIPLVEGRSTSSLIQRILDAYQPSNATP